MYKLLKIKLIQKGVWILSFVFFLNPVFGQVKTFQSTNQSKVVLTGTSSLHDWEMEAAAEECRLQAEISATSITIDQVSFKLPIQTLKSEHAKMDGNAYKALKSKKYPDIKFITSTPQVLQLSNNEIGGTISGVLEIAGVEKPVELKLTGKQIDSSHFNIQFEFPFDMELFNVEPPSLMFGTITTGKDVKTSFELYFNELNQYSKK